MITTNRQSIQKELESWLERPLSQLDIFATYNIITNVVMLVESGVASALTIEGAVKNISIGHIKERCIKYKHRTGIQKVYLGFMLIFFARVKEH